MKIDLPFLLDGDLAGDFAAENAGKCVQRQMLRCPDRVAALQREFVAAGAKALRAPTGGLTDLELAGYPETADSRRLNRSMVALTNQAAQGKAPVAGVIRSTGHLPEPFGPLPFTDLIDTYAQQALELADAGAKLLVLQDMHTMADVRAAVLGARQTGLDIIVLLKLEQAGAGAGSADPLSVMLCLQELGITAFGISHNDPEEMAGVLRRLAPYAEVPLLAQPDAGLLTPEELSRLAFELLACGAQILAGGCGATPAHIAALRGMMDSFDFEAFPVTHRNGDSMLLADGVWVYYLEEDFTTTQAVECEMDMSESILHAEAEGVDAILFHVRSVDDAYHLGQNAYMAGIAASILADTEEALEMALLYYNGRALVDSRSDMEPGIMQALAVGYGAIVR